MTGRPAWRVAAPHPDRETLARELGVSPLVAQLLLNRNLTTATAVRRFWNEGVASVHAFVAVGEGKERTVGETLDAQFAAGGGSRAIDVDPSGVAAPGEMAGMQAAVDRLQRAADRGEKVLVHGDYDVDGLTGTAVLLAALRAWGIRADYHVPSRGDGYGLSRETVAAAAGNYGLLLTVDCGVTAVAEVAAAREAGLDVIVTDHHLPAGDLPSAVAVLDPHREDCPYPFKELSGVGVAFRLVQAAAAVLGAVEPAPLLPLVALGTLADAVPLRGENRILAAEGLRRFWDGPPGLCALARAAGVEGTVRSGVITFGVAPRLNALGRMGDPRLAVELFSTTDSNEIKEMVRAIEISNQERRQVEKGVLTEARDMVSRDGKIAFAASPGWHPGVIGIVAARLADELGRPAFVVSLDGEEGRGSARGIPGWNVHRLLEAAAGRLAAFGGHAGAAGFSVDADQVAALEADLESRAGEEPAPTEVGRPCLEIDAEVEPEQLDEAFWHELERMEPFGRGNPEPVFLAKGMGLARVRPFGGAGEHLFLDFTRDGSRYAAVSFRSGERRAEMENAASFNLVFSLEKRRFRGREEKRFRVEDFAPVTGVVSDGGLFLDRERLLVLYRRLLPVRVADLEAFVPPAADLLPPSSIRLGLTIFRELGLLVREQAVWRIAPPRQRLNLNDSPTYRRGTGV